MAKKGGSPRDFFNKFLSQLKLVRLIVTEPKVGCLFRLVYAILLGLGLLWLFTQVDILPGWVDDAFVVFLLLYLIPEFLPMDLLDELKVKAGLSTGRTTATELASQIKLVWFILTSGRVGCFFRLAYASILGIGFVYMISPLDCFRGFLDDALLAYILMYVLPQQLPKEILAPLKAKAGIPEKPDKG